MTSPGGRSYSDNTTRHSEISRSSVRINTRDGAYGEASQTDKLTDASLRSHQTTFTSTVSTLRWLGTQGLRFILQFWFSKSPMFWIPAGWVPYYAEWILSFPRAPLGSVSINIWGIACASVIALVGEALTAAYVLATRKPAPTAGKQEEPMAHKARPAAKQEAKKEL